MRKVTGYKKFMDDNEIRLLFNYVNSQTKPIKLIFYIMIMMGLRVGEVCTLKREYLHGNQLTFPLEKSHGRMHTRIVPNYLKDMIVEYCNDNHIHKGYIFTTSVLKHYNGGHEHIVTDTIGVLLSKFRKYNGLTEVYYTCKDGKKLYRISPHTIRHHFLTKLYDVSGGNIMLVKEIIGHVHIDTTAAYITAWQKNQQEEKLVNQMIYC